MRPTTRWLYHLLPAAEPIGKEPADRYAPPSLASQGFVHCSYLGAVRESARLHFPIAAALSVLRLDPRLLDAAIIVEGTPRGPMPHVHGPIPARAIAARFSLAELDGQPDAIGDDEPGAS